MTGDENQRARKMNGKKKREKEINYEANRWVSDDIWWVEELNYSFKSNPPLLVY